MSVDRRAEGLSPGDHRHGDRSAHAPGHGHSHGQVDASIKRSREGLVAVGLSFLVLGITAAAQAAVFVLLSDSVALLADLIHNIGDAATAIPLGIAFALRSARAERIAGLFVVFAIFASACVAGYEAIDRLINPREPEYLLALAAAGALGFAGNCDAAPRTGAGCCDARRARTRSWSRRAALLGFGCRFVGIRVDVLRQQLVQLCERRQNRRARLPLGEQAGTRRRGRFLGRVHRDRTLEQALELNDAISHRPAPISLGS